MRKSNRSPRLIAAVAAILSFGLLAAGCSGSSDEGSSSSSSSESSEGSDTASDDTGSDASTEEEVGVALITKDSTNPFFVTMQEGAKAEADALNVNLTIASGKEDGDEEGQVQAIEQAIARGDKGILILSNGPSVENAMSKARDAGLYVIALDTPPNDPETVDITFATDNREAGRLIGQWAAGTLDGGEATIALIDAFTDKVISVDVQRDQGFLDGMGIELGDPDVNGDEEATGQYTGGSGGNYTIVCNEPGKGAEDGGRTAMETCLTKNDDINVVYTINEPTAVGARAALDAAGKTDVLVVSVDGGCAGVQNVADGVIGATSQQYPLKMATLGMEAIANLARTGEAPETTEGLDFFNTGVALVTDNPVDGVDSIDTTATDICWG